MTANASGRPGTLAGTPQTAAHEAKPITRLKAKPVANTGLVPLTVAKPRFFPSTPVKQLREWAAGGHLPGAIKLGARWFVSLAVLERLERGEAARG